MKLESWQVAELKKPWKVVRLDTYEDVPGEIISADEATGEVSMMVKGEKKDMAFGLDGIRIVSAGRR